MRIVIPGGSGQVGAILARAFADDHMTAIGRNAPVVWDGRTLGPWVECVDGADVVINLAGRSVNRRAMCNVARRPNLRGRRAKP